MARFLARIRDRALVPLIGAPIELPAALLADYPDLGEVRWRRGGIFVRIGGWALLQPTVAAVTLWRTVFLAPAAPWDPALLLHELRHVHHFRSSAAFPLHYVWESLRRGYSNNPYEADANEFAGRRLRAGPARSHTHLPAQDP